MLTALNQNKLKAISFICAVVWLLSYHSIANAWNCPKTTNYNPKSQTYGTCTESTNSGKYCPNVVFYDKNGKELPSKGRHVWCECGGDKDYLKNLICYYK